MFHVLSSQAELVQQLKAEGVVKHRRVTGCRLLLLLVLKGSHQASSWAGGAASVMPIWKLDLGWAHDKPEDARSLGV